MVMWTWVRELLEKGKYSVNCTDSDGCTPLHYACANGHIDVVRTLISEYKADISANEKTTPLAIGVLYGELDVVLCLINEVWV